MGGWKKVERQRRGSGRSKKEKKRMLSLFQSRQTNTNFPMIFSSTFSPEGPTRTAEPVATTKEAKSAATEAEAGCLVLLLLLWTMASSFEAVTI